VVELAAGFDAGRDQLVALDDEEGPLLGVAVVLLPDGLGKGLESFAGIAQGLLEGPAQAGAARAEGECQRQG